MDVSLEYRASLIITSAPKDSAISLYFLESVETITLSKTPLSNAAIIVYAINGLSNSIKIFLSTNPFEPERAGIRAIFFKIKPLAVYMQYEPLIHLLQIESAALPRISYQYIGLIPFPGLLVVILSTVKISPFAILVLATIDFLATILFFFSESVTFLSGEPSASSTHLIPSHSILNSSGVTDALWSGPGKVLSSVKCFSINVIPKGTAAIPA